MNQRNSDSSSSGTIAKSKYVPPHLRQASDNYTAEDNSQTRETSDRGGKYDREYTPRGDNRDFNR